MENWKSYARCFFKSAAATPGEIGDPRGRISQVVSIPDAFRSRLNDGNVYKDLYNQRVPPKSPSQFVPPKSPLGTITMIPQNGPAKTRPSGLVNGINNITRGLLGIPQIENWKNKQKEYEGVRGRGFADPSKYLGPRDKYPQIPEERRDLLKRNSDEYIRLLKSRPRLLSQGL